MSIAYPNLAAAVAKRGIKKTSIASSLEISTRSLYSKMSGEASFTWEEVCRIQKNFFPDMDKDFLFAPSDDGTTQKGATQ